MWGFDEDGLMWIYWDEQCEYCKYECDELEKNKVQLCITKLKELQNEYNIDAYGVIDFECDDFIYSYKEYNNSPEGQQAFIDKIPEERGRS